jgi:hypothetical protein
MTSPHDGDTMSVARLQALVDSYGANLARIPEAERARVETLLAQSEEAMRIWREAAQLDNLLDDKPASLAPSPALMQRLQDIPVRAARGSNVVELPRRVRAWASAAAAAALLLGVFTGAQDHEDDVDASTTVVASSEATGDDATLSEFGALAFSGDLVTDLGAFEGEQE